MSYFHLVIIDLGMFFKVVDQYKLAMIFTHPAYYNRNALSCK